MPHTTKQHIRFAKLIDIYIYILPTYDNEIQLVLLELPVDKYIELIGKCDNLV